MSEVLDKRELVPKLRFPEFSGTCFATGDAGDHFRVVTERNPNEDLPILAITQDQGAIPRDLIDYNVSVTDESLATYKVVRKGDFIISLRSFQGGIERSSYTGLCSPAYIILRADEHIEAEFFRHYFKTKEYISQLNRELEGLRDGKMISYSQFARIPLPMPSIAEQQKIAACLESLDNLIAAGTERLKALKRHKKGLLQQIFPVEGETVPRLRFPKYRNASEWQTTVIREIATISSGTTPSRANSVFFLNGTIPWVKTLDLNNSEIGRTEEMVTKESGVKVNPIGSVLVAMYGGFNQIGRTGILTMPAATNQAIAVLAPDTDILNPRYLLMWLNANVELWKRVAASSRKDANITANDVASFPISFPDVEEQMLITSAMETIEWISAVVSQDVEDLRTHKAALLQQLFPSLDEPEP